MSLECKVWQTLGKLKVIQFIFTICFNDALKLHKSNRGTGSICCLYMKPLEIF